MDTRDSSVPPCSADKSLEQMAAEYHGLDFLTPRSGPMRAELSEHFPAAIAGTCNCGACVFYAPDVLEYCPVRDRCSTCEQEMAKCVCHERGGVDE